MSEANERPGLLDIPGVKEFPEVRCVGFDAMNTLFQGKGSREEMNATLMQRELHGVGVHVEVEPQALADLTAEVRSHHEDDRANPHEYWRRVNGEIVRKFAPKLDDITVDQVALAVHEKVLSDPTLYEVPVEFLGLLEKLHQDGIRTLIASNQTYEHVAEFVRHFKLERYFPDRWIFTSDLVGVRKTSPVFWLRVQSLASLTIGWDALDEVARTYMGWASNPMYQAAMFQVQLFHEIPLEACRRQLSLQGQHECYESRFEFVQAEYPELEER